MSKRMIFYTFMFIVFLFAFFIEQTSDTRPFTPGEAMEGTQEDPFARKKYEWLRLHDPAIHAIPNNIRSHELEFVKKLSDQTGALKIIEDDQWIARGPYNIGGRTKALALDIKNENTVLAGGVSSGMWKSIDDGASWTKSTASNQIHSVSCIAQNKAPGREYIWYYGTGEWSSGRGGSAAGPLGTNAFYRGDGIFKSVDNGNSWYALQSTISATPTAVDSFDFIWDLEFFGDDSIYAATASGLYKSENGGDSWDPVLNFGADYPSTEIARTSQGICYASIGGKGPANGIYRCIDEKNWENISPPDWPDTTVRTVIAVSPSNENIIYFLTEVAHWKQTLRRYETGVGWTDLSQYLPFNAEMTTYGGNMLILYVKPDDTNTIFLGTVGLYRSKDGGQSFELIGGYSDFHVDQQTIVFYPSDPKVMIVGNDGGVFRTLDNTADAQQDPRTGEYHIQWESLNNGYLTTQFYTISIDHGTENSETIFGGTQDNAWLYTFSAEPDTPWASFFGGAADGGFTAISDSGEFYYAGQSATFAIWRHSFPDGQHQWTEITPASAIGMGLWMNPFILDPQDTKIMYLPSRSELWRNSDLTQIPFVFPPVPTDYNWIKLENVNPQHSISALGMSAAEPRRLYFASSYGELFRLDNPHENQPVPVDIVGENFPYYPDCPYIHCIAVDPLNSEKVIVVFPNYGVISLYASGDSGNTWTPVSGNLEENVDGTGSGPSVRWVSILYVQGNPVYFAGTSCGLFSTTELNGMATVWTQEGVSKIGCVVIDMIDVRQSDGFVVIGTHGNGAYSADVTELPAIIEHITVPPVSVSLYQAYPNPFNAMTHIKFILSQPELVKIEIFNSLGQRIETLIDKPMKVGENQVKFMADDLPTGIYYYRMQAGNFQDVKKVVLLK